MPIYSKLGHPAIHCWYHFNHSIQPYNLPQAFSTLNLEVETSPKEWTSDTGASANMTSHEGILINLCPYTGYDHVLIGNGDFLHIKHVGDIFIGYGDHRIILHDVIPVLQLERNLLSIEQLTSDYPLYCEFTNSGFVIKDRVTSQVLMRIIKQDNLYLVCASPVALFSNRF